MPATAARIGFVLQPVRRALAESPEVAARHGSLARRDDEPAESFFDNVADAQAMAEQRQALLSPERRRFAITVKGLDEAIDAPAAGPTVPQARYVDDLRGIALDGLVAEIGFDFAGQKASFVVWG